MTGAYRNLSHELNARFSLDVQVAYLSFASWNDSRQENEDRLRSTKRTASPPAGARSAGAPAAEDGKQKKDAKAASTSKGFGRK